MSVDVEVDQPDPAAPSVVDADALVPVRHRVVDFVPHDPLFRVRVALMTVYGIGYVWWFRERGLQLCVSRGIAARASSPGAAPAPLGGTTQR